MQEQSTYYQYFPILIQALVALGFVVTTMVVTHMLGPKTVTKNKLISFESGIESVGNARMPFSIKYFLTAILFVLFDVEVIFMYPWAVNFREMGMQGFLSMLIFMGFFMAGFFYIVKKGALKWE
ncbi:MAG: NADH-quinone oxidoreductase subunit A [Sphingobacteriales bacterium]|nr:MAG: NADH-quinone oxidoreductase subunit A [Sphingobacteriales bacterium]